MNEFANSLALVTQERGLERAFEVGIAGWSSLAFRVAYSVLRQREDAEDIAQDVLAKAYRAVKHLRNADRLRPWLVRMAWRLAINRRRSNARRERTQRIAAAHARPATAINTALSDDRHEELWRAIDGLPDKFRIVVVLVSIQEHDLSQVAGSLGVPEGTVKSRLFQARRLLREGLK